MPLVILNHETTYSGASGVKTEGRWPASPGCGGGPAAGGAAEVEGGGVGVITEAPAGCGCGNTYFEIRSEGTKSRECGLIPRHPRADLAQGHGHEVADVDGQPADAFGSLAVIGVEELQLHVPAVAVEATDRALDHLDALELPALGDGLGERLGGLEGVGGGEVQGPVLRGVPQRRSRIPSTLKVSHVRIIT